MTEIKTCNHMSSYDKIKANKKNNHEFSLVWLNEDLEGLRCKKCGLEVLDNDDPEFNTICLNKCLLENISMMTVIGSCGHEITPWPENQVAICIMAYTKEGQRTVCTCYVCPQCAKSYEERGIILHNENEELAWLNGEINISNWDDSC